MDKQTERQIGEQMEIWTYGWLDGQNREKDKHTAVMKNRRTG
jgi:hypothetical protein